MFDTKLRLTAPAWAVLHLLAAYEEEDERFNYHASALYNGRERGIVFTVKPLRGGDALHIFVAEARSSDQILVLQWTGYSGINPPVIGDIPQSAWDRSTEFGFDEAGKVAVEIRNLIVIFVERGDGRASHDS